MPYDVIGVRIMLDDPAIKRLGEATARDMVEAAAQIIVADVKGGFTGGGGEYSQPAEGRWYYKTQRAQDARRLAESKGEESTKYAHHASAPGQPAAVDTGRLRASIDMVMMPGEPRALIGTPVKPYAVYMEFGTPGGKIKPRPYFRPAIYRYHGNNKLAYKAARHLRAIGRMR